MDLFPTSLSIFLAIVILLVLVFLFPAPNTIFFATMMGSALIIFQAIIILKDDTES